jgi:tetratricopeptide (TPR) repeat protein
MNLLSSLGNGNRPQKYCFAGIRFVTVLDNRLARTKYMQRRRSNPDRWTTVFTTFGRALILATAWIGTATIADEEKMEISVGSTGTTAARPLSSGWLDYWVNAGLTQFTDPYVLHLATELTNSGPVETDVWSRRTEAEIRRAISTDDLLSNNAWSAVRCSKEGCISAIDSLDNQVLQRQATYKARLLSYVTPRPTQLHHVDLTTVESDRITVGGLPKNHFYVIFYLFPDASTHVHVADRSKSVIGAVIVGEMNAAHDALQRKQWGEALEHLEAAAKKEDLTAFDRKTIFEMKGYTYIKLRDFQMAQRSYENALVLARDLSEEDALENTRHILRLGVLNKNYLKSVEVGRSLVERGAANPDDVALISEGYFGLRDCKYAVKWADKSIAASEKVGASPADQLSNIKSDCLRYSEAAKTAAAGDHTLVAH